MPDLSPEERIGAYLDGEMTAAERAQMERQLAENAAWRKLLEEFRTLRAGLQGLPRHPAPASLADAVQRQIASTAPGAEALAPVTSAAPAPAASQPAFTSAPQPLRGGTEEDAGGHWQRRRWLRRIVWPTVAVSLALFLSYRNREERPTVDRTARVESQDWRAPGGQVPMMRSKNGPAGVPGDEALGDLATMESGGEISEGGFGAAGLRAGGLGGADYDAQMLDEASLEDSLAAPTETQVVTLDTPQSKETVRLLLAAIAQQGVPLEGEDRRSSDWLANLPQRDADANLRFDTALEAQSAAAAAPATAAANLPGAAPPAADAPTEVPEVQKPRSSVLKKQAHPTPLPLDEAETAMDDRAAENFRDMAETLQRSNALSAHDAWDLQEGLVRQGLAPNEEALVVELVLPAEQWADVIDGLRAEVGAWSAPADIEVAVAQPAERPAHSLRLHDSDSEVDALAAETRKQAQAKRDATRPATGDVAADKTHAARRSAQGNKADGRMGDGLGGAAPEAAATAGAAASVRQRTPRRGLDDEQESFRSETTNQTTTSAETVETELGWGRVRIVSRHSRNEVADSGNSLAESNTAKVYESRENSPAASRPRSVEQEQGHAGGAAKSVPAAPTAPADAAEGQAADASVGRASGALAKEHSRAELSKGTDQKTKSALPSRRSKISSGRFSKGESAPDGDPQRDFNHADPAAEAVQRESLDSRALQEKSFAGGTMPDATRLVRGVLVIRLQPEPAEAAPAEPAGEPAADQP